jgi:hypothetical protein
VNEHVAATLGAAGGETVPVTGLDTVKELSPAAFTVKLVEIPVIEPCVAVSVVDWAS